MAPFDSLLWQRSGTAPRRERPPAIRLRTHDSMTEWTAVPLGRLGRPLVAEIETYLEFFAIAHGHSRR
jgi:hypothetical protein